MTWSHLSVIAYFVAMTLVIYLGIDRAPGGPITDVLAAVIFLVHPALGWIWGRWWAALLPLALIAISVPAGYPVRDGHEPLPVWFAMAVYAPIFGALVALGASARWLYERSSAKSS